MNKAAVFLLVTGLLQISGEALQRVGFQSVGCTIQAIGAATTASPAPNVFSAVRGMESYSMRLSLEWQDRSGTSRSLLITPENYGSLRGPNNRRTVYGAVLGYGPVLATDERTEAMYRSVARYALCGEAPLLRELGIKPEDVDGPVRVRYDPQTKYFPSNLPRALEIPCP